MGLNILSSQSRFTFQVLGSPVETPVVNIWAHEKISATFLERVLLATSLEIKTFDNIIGKESLLTVINNDRLSGNNRYFHGVVRKFEHTGMSGRKFLYEAEVVPSVYFLSLRKNCRIFQETTTQEIIKALLEESGVNSDRYRFALENTDRKRGFCVQYQESDLDFISRLMEEEGIYYFFEHYKDKHVLVMSDNLAVHVPINGKPSITCNSGDGLVADKESVNHFTFSQRRTSEAFVHSNFFFKKPGVDLTRKKTESKQPLYEVYEYAALHISQAHGDILAKARLEQLVALQKQGHGQSSSCRLIPGYKVTLTGHDSKSLNAEYLIIDVTHSGSQPQSLEENSGGSASFGNSFTVIPAATQFRPAMITPKPIITGLQTAIVVGPKGEEIHTDEHGRAKVQFHWDREGQRNDKSSCWLRVSQTWGGGRWGSQFIPRIGDEVLVDFIEGNPDRPLITGCVYNGDNQPINSLKKSITQSGFRTKTHKGKGFHELRFDDAKGKEEIYLQSEKDWNILVKNRKGLTVGGDSGAIIGRNRDTSVGGNSYTIVKGKSTEKAKEIIVGADDIITIVSGKSSIVIKPGSIEIKSPIVKVNSSEGAPMPAEQPVSGCTGKGGSSGGGGGGGGGKKGGSSSKGAANPTATQEPAQPDDGWKAGPVKDVDEPTTEANDHLIYPDGTMAPGSVWGQGDLSADIMKHTPKGGGWTEIPPGGMPEMKQTTSGLGDLVSSATSSLPGDLVSNASRIASAVQNPESIKDAAVAAGRSKVALALDKAKGAVLEKSGIGDMQDKMTKLSEKPKDLLGDRRINPEDVIKKM
jgi:type VI secretion system secreted protein VgrG